MDSEIIKKAFEIIKRDNKPFIYHLQRTMILTYNQALEIMNELEKVDLVGQQIGNKPREIKGG
jgi:DNA segregation ATPase FtsK/SpoIIIE-like protein